MAMEPGDGSIASAGGLAAGALPSMKAKTSAPPVNPPSRAANTAVAKMAAHLDRLRCAE